MRPGQNNNKRMRGNRPQNNRRGPNPLTRSYESNGPDVKIRGNAHHIAEKYLQLARDAHTGGDPVAAENYLQHAEHYFRLIAAAQAAQAQAQSGRPPGEGENAEFEDDDDFGGVSDRFASPAERTPAYQPQQGGQPYAPPQPAAPGAGPQPYAEGGERPPQPQGDRGGYQGQNRPQQGQRPQQDRGPRQDRGFGDRQGGDRQAGDRQGGDRQGGRDFRQRDFRPYRDANPPREQPPAVGGEPAALPSFITAAPRVTAPSETEGQPPTENMVEAGGGTEADSGPFEQSADGRFPGRGRRRRLRSPYGFHASNNQDEEGEGPVGPDETPVSE
ncbi:MAG: DUF4167 domain-containing protein [Bradyrhizobium sp.]|nr:MAG: DUF4167 domain-containing protein [Bradyrhizobium sp.]